MSEEELSTRIERVLDSLKSGKLEIAPHLAEGFQSSIAEIRRDSSGKIDADSVDGRLRAAATLLSHFEYEDQVRSAVASVDIQKQYFEIVEAEFGDLFRIMVKKKSNPGQIANLISKDSENVLRVQRVFPHFLEVLGKFWEGMYEPARAHVQHGNALRGIFGGDLAPSHTKNIVSSCGLYLDTVVLNEPFLHSRQLLKASSPEKAAALFVKHGLNILRYKEVCIADLQPPIALVIPGQTSLFNEHRDLILAAGEKNGLKFASDIFGRTFETKEDLISFGASLDSIAKVVDAAKKPERILFDTEWRGDLGTQIARAMKEDEWAFPKIYQNAPGVLVVLQCLGRMMQAEDAAARAALLGGVPLIEAPTSWQYFDWRLDGLALRNGDQALHITRGLQHSVQNDLEWIGRIPPDALIAMRQSGAADELRKLLASGLEEVLQSAPENFFRVSDAVVENLSAAHAKHEAVLRQLKKDGLKFYGYDVGSWVVKGGIEVAVALTGFTMPGLATLVVDQVFDGPKIKELPRGFRELQDQKRTARNSAAGLLFAHKD